MAPRTITPKQRAEFLDPRIDPVHQKVSKGRYSGFPGVQWCEARRQWRARIYVWGKVRPLGYFDELEDAKAAVCDVRAQYNAST